MNETELLASLRKLNESELFYRDYRLASMSPVLFGEYIAQLDPGNLLEKKLLVPEIPQTIPPEYLEEWFFPPNSRGGIFVYKHNCYTPPLPHHHHFFELFYVLEGSCVHSIGQNHSILRPGDCCLIQPKVTHSIDVSDESIVIDILIKKSTFRDYFYSILQGDNLLSTFFMSTLYAKTGIDFIIFHTDGDHEMRGAMIDLCLEFVNKEAYYTELVNSISMRIFVLLLRRHMESCELPASHTLDTARAMEFIRFIQEQSLQVTLRDIADHFHYTPPYASKMVRQTTGRTFSQLLTHIRLENATQILRDTTLTVTQAATSAGYANPEHFIRTFHKEFGQTPSEYRREKGSLPK